MTFDFQFHPSADAGEDALNEMLRLRIAAAHDAAVFVADGLDADAKAMVAARLSDVLQSANLDELVPVVSAVLDGHSNSPDFRFTALGFAAWAHHVAAGEDAQAAVWWPLLSSWVAPETLNAAICALPKFVQAYSCRPTSLRVSLQ